MAINWRDKFLAFSIHFIATLLLALAAAALIFLVWYPDPFHLMVRGLELFLLVVGCDLALGPLLSFVVFDRKKTRLALVIDYTVIGIVQIAGMVYGIVAVAESRPVYVAFHADRFEVVAARDLEESELSQASRPEFRKVPLGGPRLISVIVPDKEREGALFESVAGKPEFVRPRFYADFDAALPQLRKHALPLAELEKKHPATKPLLAEARAEAKLPEERLRWLPVSTRRGFWTAVVDVTTGKPVAYFDYDPY